MPKSSLKSLCVVLAVLSSHALAQEAPSSETLVLSLKTMSKAVADCKQAYRWVQPGSTSPLLKQVIGEDGYNKTDMSLERAEKIAKFLIEHPNQINDELLVAIMSTSDDISVGIGSTRTEILTSIVRKDSKVTPQMAKELTTSNINLNACQKSLFNAGDNYVGLVLNYIKAEDRLVETSKPR